MGDVFCSGAGRREREGEEEVRPAGAALAEGASAWAEGAAGVGRCGGGGVLAAAQAPGCRVLRTGCLGGEGVRRGGVIVRAGAGARAWTREGESTGVDASLPPLIGVEIKMTT